MSRQAKLIHLISPIIVLGNTNGAMINKWYAVVVGYCVICYIYICIYIYISVVIRAHKLLWNIIDFPSPEHVSAVCANNKDGGRPLWPEVDNPRPLPEVDLILADTLCIYAAEIHHQRHQTLLTTYRVEWSVSQTSNELSFKHHKT